MKKKEALVIFGNSQIRVEYDSYEDLTETIKDLMLDEGLFDAEIKLQSGRVCKWDGTSAFYCLMKSRYPVSEFIKETFGKEAEL